jgi:Spy/CpxP family protein refolding chaperone
MVIFACGVLTGAMVMKAGRPPAIVPPAPQPPAASPRNPAPPWWQLQRLEFFKRMEKQLDVAPEQREQIDLILKESQERTKPLWDQIAPQMTEELKRVRQEVTKVLTPEQRKKMNELSRRGRKSDTGPPANSPSSRPPPPPEVEAGPR